MHFVRITQEHPYMAIIRPWYEGSFPIDERRDFDQLAQILHCQEMHVCALIDDEQPVGFIIYWNWTSVLFVEHFAIDPNLRGKQFGQKALQLLLSTQSNYVVLEVELPDDETRLRRVQFYERQGFILNSFAYAQPPYQAGRSPIPMKLMSMPAIPNDESFASLSELIRENVYQRFYAITSSSVAP